MVKDGKTILSEISWDIVHHISKVFHYTLDQVQKIQKLTEAYNVLPGMAHTIKVKTRNVPMGHLNQ